LIIANGENLSVGLSALQTTNWGGIFWAGSGEGGGNCYCKGSNDRADSILVERGTLETDM
jgi:hypothetical protein